MSSTSNCTATFDANPDVSGIGILIAFYTQAMLNFVLLISSSGVWMVRTHREELHESLNKLKSELADDWVAMGLAMTIAALSQWSTISIFHLYLCTTFATTIPAVGFIRSDYTRWSQDPLRTIYFTAFRMSRIVLLSCFIYRFVQFWGNAPGQCFRFTKDPGIPGIPVASDDALGKSVIANMAILILVDILVGIEMLLHMSNANYRNRVAQITKAWDARHPFPLKPIIGASIILPSSILGINTVLASRTQIIGDENSFSFGQVTALVTLVASFYKMGKSIYTYWYQQSHPTTAKEKSVKDLGDDNTPMLPVSSMPPPMSSASKQSNP